MTRISSKLTIWYKRGFPIFWFGFLAFFVASTLLSGSIEKDLTFLIVPCTMGIFGFFVMKRLLWDLVDEVYDYHDFLLIRNHGEEERVALSNHIDESASDDFETGQAREVRERDHVFTQGWIYPQSLRKESGGGGPHC